MDEAGIPHAEIMEMAGWKTESMFRRYRIGSAKRIAAVGRKMEEYMEAQRAAADFGNGQVQ
jgi:hypothetical protein